MYRNNFPYMELPRKMPKRVIEPVDEWLQNEGYYRKHCPKDPTCLFRAISEQVYHNQRSHLRVREECVEYMRQNKQLFEEKTMIPVGNYCDQMACITEWGGENEVYAMSLLYKRNVVMFDGQKLSKSTTIDHGFRDNFYLCFSPPKQYETVYSQEYTSMAGFCQSIIYQLLYKNVFKMSNVDMTVHKMLHERNNNLRHDKFFLKGNIDNRNQMTELLNNFVENEESDELQLIDKGITPFPYRVAKALDPNIYRNIDYDIWHEIRKEVRNAGFARYNSSELQTGSRCIVQIDLKDSYTGYIQEMSKNHGPVVVFVEELGQNMTYPFENLKPYPQRKFKTNNNWPVSPNKRNLINQTNRKKPWNNNGTNRRTKDQTPNDNGNYDKNQNNIKSVSKNVINKPDGAETQPKLQNENYATYNEYNTNSQIDNLKTALENTRISTETAEQTAIDKKSASNVNGDTHENLQKKQAVTNFNHETNLLNKQNHQRVEKNDIFYPPCPGTNFHPIPRFPGDLEMVNYDVTKNFDIKGNEVSSDPATVRLFYNLGVKCYVSQNMISNGTNCQPHNDNTFYVIQPAPDPNVYPNMINGPVFSTEPIVQPINNHPNNQNVRHNNRSSPPQYRDHENANGLRSNGQKMNPHRNQDFRNMTYQPQNNDNRNRNDGKNANPNELSQQGGCKDMQRGGNKSNGLAPRFKRNYEAGKNRSDYYNNQHQYRQQQQPQQHPHYQQDYDMRNKKQQHQQQQQFDLQMIQNRSDLNDPAQQHHPPPQQQQQPPLPNSVLHQPAPHVPHQPPPMAIQAQTPTPPPLTGPYPYQVPFNQVSYVPIGSYSPDSDSFSGPYYPAPSGYVQVPYLPASELQEQPMYQHIDSFPAQFPPMYSQYVYPPPAATIYSTQPPPPDGCYHSTFPGQPYFFPYPPPPLPPGMQPANLGAPPTPQSAQ